MSEEKNQKGFAIHFILTLDKFLFSISLIQQIDIGHVSQAGISKWAGENQPWGKLRSSWGDWGL